MLALVMVSPSLTSATVNAGERKLTTAAAMSALAVCVQRDDCMRYPPCTDGGYELMIKCAAGSIIKQAALSFAVILGGVQLRWSTGGHVRNLLSFSLSSSLECQKRGSQSNTL